MDKTREQVIEEVLRARDAKVLADRAAEARRIDAGLARATEILDELREVAAEYGPFGEECLANLRSGVAADIRHYGGVVAIVNPRYDERDDELVIQIGELAADARARGGLGGTALERNFRYRCERAALEYTRDAPQAVAAAAAVRHSDTLPALDGGDWTVIGFLLAAALIVVLI